MGNDAPLAVLSRNRKLLPDYFKQLFAQVRRTPCFDEFDHVRLSLRSPPATQPPGRSSCLRWPRRPVLPAPNTNAHILHIPLPLHRSRGAGEHHRTLCKHLSLPGILTWMLT